MSHRSIAETGAKAGDKVVCVEVLEAGAIPGVIYVPGRIYDVVETFDAPMVKHDGSLIPSNGFGAAWRLATVDDE